MNFQAIPKGDFIFQAWRTVRLREPTSLGNPYRIKGNPPKEPVPSCHPPLDPGFFMAISGWWTITKNPMPPTDDAIIGGKCRFRWFFWGTETFKRWTCWFLQDCTQRGTTQTHFLRTETKQIILRQGLYANHDHWIFEHQHHFLWPLVDWKKIDIF